MDSSGSASASQNTPRATSPLPPAFLSPRTGGARDRVTILDSASPKEPAPSPKSSGEDSEARSVPGVVEDPFLQVNNDGAEGAVVSHSELSRILMTSVMNPMNSGGTGVSRAKDVRRRRTTEVSRKKSARPSAAPSVSRGASCTAQWDYELRLPTSIGSMPEGDHFFTFGRGDQWMINVCVEEIDVGVYLHYYKPKLVTCTFKIGEHIGALDDDGRNVSERPDDGWGLVFDKLLAQDVTTIFLTPVDVLARRGHRARAAMQFINMTAFDICPSSARNSQPTSSGTKTPSHSARSASRPTSGASRPATRQSTHLTERSSCVSSPAPTPRSALSPALPSLPSPSNSVPR